MRLTYDEDTNEFAAENSYNIRRELASAGFTFRRNRLVPAWVTNNRIFVLQILGHVKEMTPEAREVLAAHFGAANIPNIPPSAPKPLVQTDAVPQWIEDIHMAVKLLAGKCDGARSIDGHGFNKMDSRIGKEFAERRRLSEKQANWAKKFVRKYKRQLPVDLYIRIYG